MAGRNPAEALDNYLAPLRRAVQCVARSAQLISDCHNPQDGESHYVSLAGNQPVRISTPRGDVRYLLMVQQRFRIIRDDDEERGPWRATTQKYDYSLEAEDGAELVAYHWHPAEQGFDEPHLHVGDANGPVQRRMHLPTARVPVEDFIRLLIREFDIAAADQNYRRILEGSKERFLRFKGW